MNVLYVDDEADLRELAQFSLELDPEMSVTTADSGDAALAHLRQAAVDVVLLDVMMPRMDGPSVLAALRSEIGSQPPVIFVTARALPDERRRLMGVGGLEVITKPFDPMTLAQQVRLILERARG